MIWRYPAALAVAAFISLIGLWAWPQGLYICQGVNCPPVLNGISLSNTSFTGGSPSGTVVGNLSVIIAPGSFTGSYQSLSGPDGSKFQIVGTAPAQLETLTASLAAGTYNVTVCAQQANTINNSICVPFQISGTATVATFPLSVSGGVLQTAAGQPYMILADSPQGANAIPLCAAGNTYALCQTSTDTLPTNATFVAFARDRQAQGFNSLWINILCEPYTGCAGNGADNAGNLPFTTGLSGTGFAGGFNGAADTCSGTPSDMDCWDMSTAGSGASAAYWAHIDGYFQVAAQFGMQVLANPLPIDACVNHAFPSASIGFMYLNNYQLHPGQASGAATMNAFADFLYARYGNPTSAHYAPNLMWMLGNDYQCWDSVAYSNQLVSGADAVFYAFASRLHSDEAGAGHHLIFTETDGAVTPSLVDQVSTWQNAMDLDGLYSGAGTVYDVALSGLAQAASLGLSPPPPGFVVETSYQGEDNNANKYDGTATGTNISGCGENNVNVTQGGDPNRCPFAERVQFWQAVLGGSFAGYLDGNHYVWPFTAGWNNGTGLASGTCTGTSGAGHSPCIDTIANGNLKNAVAFLQTNIAWYKLVPDLTRGTDSNGIGTGVSIASPLVSNGTANDGCYPNNACTNYYIGSNRANSGSNGGPNGISGGQLQNRMPIGGKTSDGKSGIVYLGGTSTSCGYSITNRVYTSCVPATGLQLTVNNALINGGSNVTAAWYDPSGPMTSPASTICSPSTTTCNSGTQVYTTPSSGHTDAAAADWILLLTSSGGGGGGQTPSTIAIGGDGCSGTACSVPNVDNYTSFTASTPTGLPPNGTYIGTLSTTLLAGTPPFSGSYQILNSNPSGGNCTSGTLDASATTHFQIGSTDQLQYNSSATRGTSYNICVQATVGAASTTQEFTVTVYNVVNAALTYCTAQNGGGTGALGSPWHDLCIIAAANAASTGDTVFLAAGNWQLDITKATATGNISTSTAAITSMSTVTGIVVGQYVGDITILPPTQPQSNKNLPGDPGQNTLPPTVTGINTGCSPTPCVTISANPLVTATGDTFGFGIPVYIRSKVINIMGAGSGNTFDTSGHPNNGKGSVSGTYARVYPSGTIQAFPGGFIQFANCTGTPGPTVSHIFFDGQAAIVSNQSDQGGDFSGTINFVYCNAPTVNDIRVLAFNNAPLMPNTQYFVFGDSTHGSSTTRNSVLAEPISSSSSSLYGGGQLFQEQNFTTANVDNNIFYQGFYNGFFIDNVTFTRNSVYNFNDGTAAANLLPLLGSAGTTTGSYHFYVKNSLIYSLGNGYGIGGGVNDSATNGIIVDQQYSGNWMLASSAWPGSCVWRWYDVAFSGTFCDPTNAAGSQGMQISNTTRDGVTNGMSFINNSFVGSTTATIDFQGNGCPGTGAANVGTGSPCSGSTLNIMQCVDCTAQNNYLSGPSDQFLTDANSVSFSQTNNYCNGTVGTWSSGSCNTTGFNTAPTASFTLGNLYQVGGTNYVPFATESFTAQYGAVEWYASTSPTCPANTSANWSSNNTSFPAGQLNTYVPPVTLSGVSHGSKVYLCVMDHAGNGTASGNHVSSATPQTVP